MQEKYNIQSINFESNKALQRRFFNSLIFVKKYVPKNKTILDLGPPNDLSEFLRTNGFIIKNTADKDLDVDFNFVKKFNIITAFEIFEHMFAPFNILNAAKGKLIASVPLKLWFVNAYWNDKDKKLCHYHEFEIKQFNHLLERTGWKIKDSMTWASYNTRIGIRPLLRRFHKRYYMVYAEKREIQEKK